MSFISGYHHLTLSTDGAQEDYDFYTKTLGLHSIKRTVLFDGTIPVSAPGTPIARRWPGHPSATVASPKHPTPYWCYLRSLGLDTTAK